MKKMSGYVGQIPNSATMNVKAPNQVKENPTPKVKKGKDLRTGKTGK